MLEEASQYRIKQKGKQAMDNDQGMYKVISATDAEDLKEELNKAAGWKLHSFVVSHQHFPFIAVMERTSVESPPPPPLPPGVIPPPPPLPPEPDADSS